jgi:negative regulator of flagellin synthesis FlgM
MKIDNSIKGLTGQTPSVANSRPAAQSTQATQSAQTAKPDSLGAQVALSGAATRLVKESEGFNAARVAEIRQAMAEGRFQINPEKIADGLIDSVRDFLDRRQASA